MDSILSKMGIYDLIGVLCTGTIITIFSNVIIDKFNIAVLSFEIQGLNSSIVFIITSYFIGLAFQEIGSLVCKHLFFRKNRLLSIALKSKNKSAYLMSENELQQLKSSVIENETMKSNQNDIVYIYNKCKYHYIKSYDTIKIDKDQSMSAMSRSLCIYFFTVSIILASVMVTRHSLNNIWVLFLTLSLMILMYIRFKRFVIIRYVHIMRTYLYDQTK